MSRFILLFGALAVFLSAANAAATVPQRMHYQGYLETVAGDPVQCPSADDCEGGPFAITLRLYGDAEGGSPVWEETHSDVKIRQGALLPHPWLHRTH